MPDLSDPAAAALHYAQLGFPVFPCHGVRDDGQCTCRSQDCSRTGKHPVTPHGLKDASIDPNQVRRWWEQFPGANIGLALTEASGLVVVDIDGPEGEASAAELDLPPTLTQRTGRGRHLFYRSPGGLVRNATGVVPGVDLRGPGGYVIVAPSRHAGGAVYAWEGPGLGEAAIATAPEWVLGKGGPPAAAEGEGDIQPAAPIPQGTRNATLCSIGGSLRRKGLSEAAIGAALRVVNLERCQPPLPEAEVVRIAASVARYEPQPGAPVVPSSVPVARPGGCASPPASRGGEREFFTSPSVPGRAGPLPPLPTTDYGNAERLVAAHGADLHYCTDSAKWLVWDGTRWAEDVTGEVMRRAKHTVRSIYHEAREGHDFERRQALERWAKHSESEASLRAMIGLAQSERGIPVRLEDLDADPFLLNTHNGVIDLRTCELLPHDRSRLITKRAGCAYVPGSGCTRFLQFLQRVTGDRPELMQFLWRACGYALTGSVREQALFLCHGAGANGKSTFLEVLAAVLGDYARRADFETFLHRDHRGVPNDLARLAGARLVTATEADEGRRLSESLIKQLTGGDRIAARFLHQEFFEFAPAFKLFLATNHRPSIRGTDHALWRRMRLVPFDVTFSPAEQDQDLPAKLREELPGILAWMVAGCAAWQERGLGEAEPVRAATEAYRQEQDPLGAFLAECVQEAPGQRVPSAELYAAYTAWAEANGEHAMSHTRLGRKLKERGWVTSKDSAGASRGRMSWEGLALVPAT
ncbi:MAG TPA: phage/plasmid primase, P4 family [Armatimonadota bacterium]|nr:phage/plasmid primase, P4 family [Armatimonadota bacterium]